MNKWLKILPVLVSSLAFGPYPAQAVSSSVVSSAITVDTRDRVIGELTIQGPSSLQAGSSANFEAFLGSENVTDQCRWSVQSFLLNAPVIDGDGILTANSEVLPHESCWVVARYSEPGGDTRQSKLQVPITPGATLSYRIEAEVSFVGTAGGGFEWQVDASISGDSASQPGTSFSWYRNNSLVGYGLSCGWTYTGIPTSEVLRVIAVDGSGNNATERELSVVYTAPSPGEPPSDYDSWRKQNVEFFDKDGNPVWLDTVRRDTGLIVLTHGLRDSPQASWITTMAAAIESRLSQGDLPNIVIFGWEKDANPYVRTISYAEQKASDAWPYVSEYLGLQVWQLKILFGATEVDWLANLLTIRPIAQFHGRSSLAEWIRQQESAGLISKTAPIHLVGHSAGGFVVGECYTELKDEGYNIQRVTMLDTPFVVGRHVDAGDPAVVERYVSSDFGDICPQVDALDFTLNLLSPLISPFFAFERPDSQFYHRLDVGERTLNPVADHSTSYEWYTQSVSWAEQEGFQLSPLVQSVPAPDPTISLPSTDGSPESLELAAETPSAEPESERFYWDTYNWSTFGNAGQGFGPFYISEGGNAGFYQTHTLPPDASELTFQFYFSDVGDGEYLAVYVGDGPPAYISYPDSSNISGVESVSLSISNFAGQTVPIMFKLVAHGESTGYVQIPSSFYIIKDDDIDKDGVLTADELAAGTDTRYADTDGDGIDDATEIGSLVLSPVLADTDGDGRSDGAEIIAGTDPGDPASFFGLKLVYLDTSPILNPEGFYIDWTAVPERSYRVLRSTSAGFENFDVIATNISGDEPVKRFFDPAAIPADEPTFFYRVEVE